MKNGLDARILALLGEDALGDVGGVFDHLDRVPAHVEDRVVGGLDPHLLAALADALVAPRVVFAAAELVPEGGICGALRFLGAHEGPVMLAADLVHRVTDRAQEGGVGLNDGAVELELDDGLGLPDGQNLALELGGLPLQGRDVGRELDDLVDPAGFVGDRVVRRLEPELLAGLVHALELARLGLATREVLPELLVLDRPRLGGGHEQAMVLADDLVELVAEGREEVLVGAEDCAVRRKLDHGLGIVDRSPDGFELDQAWQGLSRAHARLGLGGQLPGGTRALTHGCSLRRSVSYPDGSSRSCLRAIE